MNRPLLVLCDTDEVYVGRLYEFLRENLKLSFEIITFTAIEILMDFVRDKSPSLLVISENAYRDLREKKMGERIKNILVLDEDESGLNEEQELYGQVNIGHTSKYQAATGVIDNIVNFCVERAEDFDGVSTKFVSNNAKIIGLFTPISKCGQTSLALSMGKELSQRGRTIFLSFESFSSLPGILGLSEEGNISDLVYYSDSDENKFCLYLEKIKNTLDQLDIIAPAKTAMQIREISYESLKHLIEMLVNKAGYEYIIMDITDYPEGLFDILRLCNKLFSIVKNDKSDIYRFELYEDVLRENGYEDVIAETIKVDGSEVQDFKNLLKREGIVNE
ncbi:MAG: hypothetical protein K6F69_07010 [Treponema sp.]|nr:hypothetical protein [Treponema sp.]